MEWDRRLSLIARRTALWFNLNLDELIHESRTILEQIKIDPNRAQGRSDDECRSAMVQRVVFNVANAMLRRRQHGPRTGLELDSIITARLYDESNFIDQFDEVQAVIRERQQDTWPEQLSLARERGRAYYRSGQLPRAVPFAQRA